MSQLIARQVLTRMNMRECLIAGAHAADVLIDLKDLATASSEVQIKAFEKTKVELCAAYGVQPDARQKPFAFSQGVAIIPMHGTLINRFGQSYGSVTGYNFIRSQLNAALADDDVTSIVFDINSYGGECAGCFELADDLYNARGQKPMMGVIDAHCYSAAYALGSSLDKLVLTPTGGAGSVGVVAMHVSLEKLLSDNGVKVEFIYAGKHKVDGNMFQDLSESARSDIQRGVDKSYDKFVATVARNRGLDEKAVRGTEAQVYRADEALELGLIDAVEPPSVAVASFLTELSGSDTETMEKPMDKEDTKKPVDEGSKAQTVDAAAVAKSERERCAAITGCEEAKGREALASHFAYKTSMSVEEAKEALAAAPLATAAAKEDKGDKNGFKAHMDKDEHPNLGEGGEGDKGGKQSAAERILANQSAATGIQHTKH